MDSKIPKADTGKVLPSAPTATAESAEVERREIFISFKPPGRARREPKAVYEPRSQCCTMTKAYLEQIGCSDKMKAMPASHNSDFMPHQRVGVFNTRIRLADKPGGTYRTSFCIVECNSETASICVGEGILPHATLTTAEPAHRKGAPARPILAGPRTQSDDKKSQDSMQKRKKEDDDKKKKEDERKSKKRSEGKKEGHSQSGKDASKQTK